MERRKKKCDRDFIQPSKLKLFTMWPFTGKKKNADYGNLGWDIATEKKETE